MLATNRTSITKNDLNNQKFTQYLTFVPVNPQCIHYRMDDNNNRNNNTPYTHHNKPLSKKKQLIIRQLSTVEKNFLTISFTYTTIAADILFIWNRKTRLFVFIMTFQEKKDYEQRYIQLLLDIAHTGTICDNKKPVAIMETKESRIL